MLFLQKKFQEQTYFVLEIPSHAAIELVVSNTLKPLAFQRHAHTLWQKNQGLMHSTDIAGLNAGFFQPSGKTVGACKVQGQWIGQPLMHKPRGVVGWSIIGGKKIWTFDRLMQTAQGTILSKLGKKNWWKQAETMIQGAPLLLAGGKVLSFTDEHLLDSFAQRRYARSAICQDVQGKIKWFLVKGGDRFFYELGLFRSKGVSLKELQSLLLIEGCVEALNLDGGYSAQLRYENTTYLGLPLTLLPARHISSSFVVRAS